MRPVVKISIVLALRNGKEHLPRMLASLKDQTYKNWELVAQDGGSDDGGPELLKECGETRIKLDVRKDNGVYEAWNLALERVEGEWVIFLGADDFLVDKYVLARAARELEVLDPTVMFAQAALQLSAKGRVTDTLARSKAEVFRFFISGMPLLTPAVFFRKDLFDEPGGRFDASYKIAGDFAFVAARLCPDNLFLLPFVLTCMEKGGLSSSVRSRPVLDRERIRVLREIVLPDAVKVVQACIDTYGETKSPLPE